MGRQGRVIYINREAADMRKRLRDALARNHVTLRRLIDRARDRWLAAPDSEREAIQPMVDLLAKVFLEVDWTCAAVTPLLMKRVIGSIEPKVVAAEMDDLARLLEDTRAEITALAPSFPSLADITTSVARVLSGMRDAVDAEADILDPPSDDDDDDG